MFLEVAPNIWQIIWFLLIAVCMIAYFVLDGFDLGVGALYPFLGKNEGDKNVMRNVVGPFWDGNEVWLLTTGGATFAAFPPAYATTFSGFYLAIMLVLFALILRATAIHFARSGTWHGFWDFAFFIGSAIPPILMGAAMGNLLQTVPLLANGDVAGAFPARFVQLLGVFPLICGVFALALAVLQGASWLSTKVVFGPLHDRAVKVRAGAQIACAVLFVLASVVFWIFARPQLIAAGGFVEGTPAILRYVFAALSIAGLIAAFVFAQQKKDLLAFIASSVFIAMAIAMVCVSLFPAIVPANTPVLTPLVAMNEGYSIMAGAPYASSNNALIAMTIIAIVGVPLVLAYHVITYRIFAGRVAPHEYNEY